MAAGEFVSVHSQADTEAANLDLELLNFGSTITANTANWRRSMSVAASIRSWRNRWLIS